MRSKLELRKLSLQRIINLVHFITVNDNRNYFPFVTVVNTPHHVDNSKQVKNREFVVFSRTLVKNKVRESDSVPHIYAISLTTTPYKRLKTSSSWKWEMFLKKIKTYVREEKNLYICEMWVNKLFLFLKNFMIFKYKLFFTLKSTLTEKYNT